MSASITAAPARSSFGRFPLALAALALVAVVALAVAIVALNSAKAAAPATSVTTGAPPAVIDHGWSSAVVYGQSVTNVPFYDHGWSKVNEPGQSVTNVPFYDHGWSTAGTSWTPKSYGYFGPYLYNGYDPYTPVGKTNGTSVVGYPLFGASYFSTRIDSVGFPPFGATYAGTRIDAVDHGARDAAAAAALGGQIDAIDHGARDQRASEPQYVAPRPRNQ